MSIISTQGDLLKQDDVDAIVNTVNCVGVMGKGIALQFKKKWPDNFKAYASACKAGDVVTGKMHIHELGALATPQFIINFPTKNHWRGKSQIEFVQTGLVDLVKQVKALHIKSIAIPPLGCGNGGLAWGQVRPMIVNAFADLPNVEVRLFEDRLAPKDSAMEVNTSKPNMTAGRAAILKLLDVYGELNYGLSRVEVQKLAYFLQEAGENLNLNFVKHQYGPYSDKLRHVLNRMDGHYIRGVGDGVSHSEIVADSIALQEAEKFIQQSDSPLNERVTRVADLIQGYQTPYGMELLATVHWALKQPNVETFAQLVDYVHGWNSRKKQLMKPEHIELARERLVQYHWL
ncbi:MAG: type II toxin-antitoxin system antitoxin DNA ADP-ribosyl glycohydrolase DarG [bacterium]